MGTVADLDAVIQPSASVGRPRLLLTSSRSGADQVLPSSFDRMMALALCELVWRERKVVLSGLGHRTILHLRRHTFVIGYASEAAASLGE